MIQLPSIFSSNALYQHDSFLTLTTPPASLQPCRILLWEEDYPKDALALDNILFGELWLASGQSNMQHYDALVFDLFNAVPVSAEDGFVQAEITFRPNQGTPYIITCKAERISDIRYGWAKFCINLENLPEDFIEQFALIFDVGSAVYRFVNVDSLVLVPKKL